MTPRSGSAPVDSPVPGRAPAGPRPLRRFVIVGSTASASGEFSTEDLPGSSGRLDVLLRCVRAALLRSHGLRLDVVIYLVLRGGDGAPRVVRITGATARFVRPDERSLAILMKKSLLTPQSGGATHFVEVRPGVSVVNGDLECVLKDAPESSPFWLDEAGADVRGETFDHPDLLFFLGDHSGLDAASGARIRALGSRSISVGPVSLHSDDVVTLVNNELDRRLARREPAAPPSDAQAPDDV